MKKRGYLPALTRFTIVTPQSPVRSQYPQKTRRLAEWLPENHSANGDYLAGHMIIVQASWRTRRVPVWEMVTE